MANTTNPWVSPYQRSFNDIKGTILSNMRANAPEITDLTEGNIFVIIVSIFAGIAEVLHYYIDSMARETFFVTARRYDSLLKHAALVNYRIRGANAATVDILLSMSDGKAFPYGPDNTVQTLVIPLNTEFMDSRGRTWVSTKTVTLKSGYFNVLIPLVQKTPWDINNDRISLGNYNPDTRVYYLTGQSTSSLPNSNKILDQSVVLYVDGEPWQSVDTLAYYGPGDKVFVFTVDNYQNPFIYFGDGKFGAVPNNNAVLEYTCAYTYGSDGNIEANSIDSVPTNLLSFQSTELVDEEGEALTINDFQVTQLNRASGGLNAEDWDMLKSHIPLSVKTLGVAITKEDYENIVKLIPGVNKVYVDYTCGRLLDIYVTSVIDDNNPYGIASEALLEQVYNRLQTSKVITTIINVHSTYETHIWLEATVTGKKSFNKTDIQNQVKKALLDNYNYITSDINKVIRLSDIYGLIENCSMIDYVEITNMYLLSSPYRFDSSDIEEVETQEEKEQIDYLNTLNIPYYKLLEFTLPQDTQDPQFSYELVIEMVNPDAGEDNSEPATQYNVYTKEGYNSSQKTPLATGTIDGDIITVSQSGQFKVQFRVNTWFENLNYTQGSAYIMSIQPRFSDKAGSTMDLYPLDFNTPVFLDNTINLTINETV